MDSTALPDDIDALKRLIIDLNEQAKAQTQHYETELSRLREQIKYLVLRRYGRSSEKQNSMQGTLELVFDEAEQLVEIPPPGATTNVGAHPRRKPKRHPLPSSLPRIVHEHDLPDDQKVCPHDGTPLKRIGETATEQLDIIPAQIHVKRHVRFKYACPCCAEGVYTAPLPPQPLPKTSASPGLLAHVAVAKFEDALPLYRQSKILKRIGLDQPRQTLAAWMIGCGQLVD